LHTTQKKTYIILTIICLLGYSWLGYNLVITTKPESSAKTVCVIKHTTGIPCPSCGSTRSVISLINGDFSKALYINPLGFLIAVIMILLPFWIITDLVNKKNTLFKFYKKIEIILQKKIIAIPLILIIIINWIWNIIKEL